MFTYFSKAIHQQLQEALEEQENLKIQISEYARQVSRIEELLAQKVLLHVICCYDLGIEGRSFVE